MSKPRDIIVVIGARPNIIKVCPLHHEFRKHPEFNPLYLHTGQHYDVNLSGQFFRQFGMPDPDINLGIASNGRISQVADIMKSIRMVFEEKKPHAVIVTGDVNSTLAAALAAQDCGTQLVHVEAGLRSFDRAMPEEINRILTDSISDLLFCTEQSGVDNLRCEGIPVERIFLVGNLMIDTLLNQMEQVELSPVLEEMKLEKWSYALLTLHRPSNVDNPVIFAQLLDALEAIQRETPILFPVHPRTRKQLLETDLGRRLEAMKGLTAIPPLGYHEFMKLMKYARAVFTDSGGIQEETTVLKVPCITLRENTERPVTCEIGTNHLAGVRTDRILEVWRGISQQSCDAAVPPLWDGATAARIAGVLKERL